MKKLVYLFAFLSTAALVNSDPIEGSGSEDSEVLMDEEPAEVTAVCEGKIHYVHREDLIFTKSLVNGQRPACLKRFEAEPSVVDCSSNQVYKCKAGKGKCVVVQVYKEEGGHNYTRTYVEKIGDSLPRCGEGRQKEDGTVQCDKDAAMYTNCN